MLYSNTVFDFISGYSLEEIEENYEYKTITVYKNNQSPFEDFGKAKVHYLKFIRNTQLAYYKIETTEKVIYHGILDIKLNKILFNTNEKITDFRPLSNYSMLAITDDTAYEICPFTKGGKCIENCEEGETLVIDYNKGNYCDKISNSDDFNFKLWIPIISGVFLLILAAIIITIIVYKRNKRNKSIKIDEKVSEDEDNALISISKKEK